MLEVEHPSFIYVVLDHLAAFVEALFWVVVVLGDLGSILCCQLAQLLELSFDRLAVVDASVLGDQGRELRQLGQGLAEAVNLEKEARLVELGVGTELGRVSELLEEERKDLHVEVHLAQDDHELVLLGELVVTVDEVLQLFCLLALDVEALEEGQAVAVRGENVWQLVEP